MFPEVNGPTLQAVVLSPRHPSPQLALREHHRAVRKIDKLTVRRSVEHKISPDTMPLWPMTVGQRVKVCVDLALGRAIGPGKGVSAVKNLDKAKGGFGAHPVGAAPPGRGTPAGRPRQEGGASDPLAPLPTPSGRRSKPRLTSLPRPPPKRGDGPGTSSRCEALPTPWSAKRTGRPASRLGVHACLPTAPASTADSRSA